MVGKNSKKVNDKKYLKKKKKKEGLTKDRNWKVVGALNCLKTKSESRRRRRKKWM